MCYYHFNCKETTFFSTKQISFRFFLLISQKPRLSVQKHIGFFFRTETKTGRFFLLFKSKMNNFD